MGFIKRGLSSHHHPVRWKRPPPAAGAVGVVRFQRDQRIRRECQKQEAAGGKAGSVEVLVWFGGGMVSVHVGGMIVKGSWRVVRAESVVASDWTRPLLGGGKEARTQKKKPRVRVYVMEQPQAVCFWMY